VPPLKIFCSRPPARAWEAVGLQLQWKPELRDAFAYGKGVLVALLTLGYVGQTPKAPVRKEGRYIIL